MQKLQKSYWSMNWANRSSSRFISSLVAAFLFACHPPQPQTTTVAGKAAGFEGKAVYLLELKEGQKMRLLLDSAFANKDAEFTLKAIPTRDVFWQVEVEDGPSVLLVADAQKINLNLSKAVLPNYVVEGSEASRQLATFYRQTNKAIANYQQFRQRYNADQLLPDSLRKLTLQDLAKDSVNFLLAIEQQVATADHPIVQPYAFTIVKAYLPISRQRSLARQIKLSMPTESPLTDSAPFQRNDSGKLPLLNDTLKASLLPDSLNK